MQQPVILIAEDDEYVARQLAKYIRKAFSNYRLIRIGNQESGVGVFCAEGLNIKAITLDMFLPEDEHMFLRAQQYKQAINQAIAQLQQTQDEIEKDLIRMNLEKLHLLFDANQDRDGGLNFLKSIHSIGQARFQWELIPIPTLCLSGYPGMYKGYLHKPGMIQSLTKPVSPEAFISTIRDLLKPSTV